MTAAAVGPDPTWMRDVALHPLTTLGVGGPARWLAPVRDASEILAALAFARDERLPWWLLGGGSNVLIADAGLPGVVIRPVGAEVAFGPDGTVRADAGLAWDALVAATVAHGLGGLECLSGIPGSCGAAPIQNIGAYGQEIADVLHSVAVLDGATGEIRQLTRAQCEFGYRDSRFKRNPGSYIVLAITLRLQPDGVPTLRYAQVADALQAAALPTGAEGLRKVRETVLALRRGKAMVLDPGEPDSRSAGSFFTNPIVLLAQANAVEARLGGPMPRWPVSAEAVKLSAAWLIEHCGMTRGYGNGNVGVSRKHTLALVNRGGATASEIVNFARHVRDRVLAASGVRLSAEPVLLGFEGQPLA